MIPLILAHPLTQSRFRRFAATKGTILEADSKSTEAIFKINIASHFILIKEFLPAMLRANKGHVVTIASMASFMAAPGLVDYCCTKVAALYLNDGRFRPVTNNTTPCV